MFNTRSAILFQQYCAENDQKELSTGTALEAGGTLRRFHPRNVDGSHGDDFSRANVMIVDHILSQITTITIHDVTISETQWPSYHHDCLLYI